MRLQHQPPPSSARRSRKRTTPALAASIRPGAGQPEDNRPLVVTRHVNQPQPLRSWTRGMQNLHMPSCQSKRNKHQISVCTFFAEIGEVGAQSSLLRARPPAPASLSPSIIAQSPSVEASEVVEDAIADQEGGADGLLVVQHGVDSPGVGDCDCDSHEDQGRDGVIPDGCIHDVVDSQACAGADPRSGAARVQYGEDGRVGCNNNNGGAEAGGPPYREVRILLRGRNTGAADQVRALHSGGGSYDSGNQDQAQAEPGWTHYNSTYIEFQYVLIDQVRRFEARARETEMELKKKETEIAQQLLGRA
mmetsp:Transcript_5004/g.12746  ORF Transcript_5004/g.12746 Transcript_5004/m.12746 type:complete len:305 (-) Transcript_5004:991-1905(-)